MAAPASAAQVAPSDCRARDSQTSLPVCPGAAANTRWPDSPAPHGDSVHQGQHPTQVANDPHPCIQMGFLQEACSPGICWGVKFNPLQNLFQLLVKSTHITNTVSSVQSAKIYGPNVPWRTLSYKKTHEKWFCPPGIYNLIGRHQIKRLELTDNTRQQWATQVVWAIGPEESERKTCSLSRLQGHKL